MRVSDVVSEKIFWVMGLEEMTLQDSHLEGTMPGKRSSRKSPIRYIDLMTLKIAEKKHKCITIKENARNRANDLEQYIFIHSSVMDSHFHFIFPICLFK